MIRAWVCALLVMAACGSKSGGGGSAIGVPECDDYVAKATACASKLGAKGDGLKRQTTSIADAWRKQAADSSMKAEMGKTCTDAIAAAKQAYADCAF